MKKYLSKICVTLITLASFTLNVNAFEPTDKAETALYNARLIPAPKSVEYGRGIVVINNRLSFSIVLPQNEIDTHATQKFVAAIKADASYLSNVELSIRVVTPEELLAERQTIADKDELSFLQELVNQEDFWQKKGSIKLLALPDPTSGDLSVEDLIAKHDELSGRIILAGSDLDAVRNAFMTISQLTEPIGNATSLMAANYFIPELQLEDSPSMAFRGIHLCWFPETDPTRIDQAIRMAAYYKFNYAVVEFWGTFPFDSNPALYWEEFHTSKAEIARLVDLGKNLGIKLIPQLNLFGHATGARVSVGKHTTLDMAPFYEPLFEPDGWTWNIYNPETRKLLTNCMLELYEAFDSPEYFHIGCDEAYSAATSLQARRSGNYVDALADWLSYFHDLLKKRGCRMMMWHDMLIEEADFNGYTAGGASQTRGLIDKLPKDILICDWEYSAPKKDESWPTFDYFQNKGFEVVSCPWRNIEGIKSLAQKTLDKNGYGILCTTWHMFYGNDMKNILVEGASSAWGNVYRGSNSDKQQAFNRHLRQASRYIPNKTYRTGGVNDWQVFKETIGPQG